MNTLIFRTAAPLIVIVMVVFAVFVLLRGHDAPGGGFIAGLIAAAAMAVYSTAAGPVFVRKAMFLPPLSLAGLGVCLAAGSGLPALLAGAPFLTGLWAFPAAGDVRISLSTPLLFDIGVFLTVFGAVTAVVLGLETAEEGA